MSLHLRSKFVVAGLALGGAALAAGLALAQAPAFFRIGTGGTAGTYYPIGGLIANAISSPPGSRACEEGGSCGVPGLIATLIWFWLVGQIGATRAATFHFLNPVFGVAIAAVLLGEGLSWVDALGVAIVAAGILAVQLSRAKPA